MERVNIPIEIEKVLELKGAIRSYPKGPSSIYAHISKPIDDKGEKIQYAMLAVFPQHGIMHLGNINSKTMMFENFDPNLRISAFYSRAENHVVSNIQVPSDQLEKLKKLEEVISIPGISVKRELIPV